MSSTPSIYASRVLRDADGWSTLRSWSSLVRPVRVPVPFVKVFWVLSGNFCCILLTRYGGVGVSRLLGVVSSRRMVLLFFWESVRSFCLIRRSSFCLCPGFFRVPLPLFRCSSRIQPSVLSFLLAPWSACLMSWLCSWLRLLDVSSSSSLAIP